MAPQWCLLKPPKKVQFSNFSILDERKNQKENSICPVNVDKAQFYKCL